jgi:hypothetical protein
MDPSGECQISPSDMLISPKWGFLLSVLLLVNLSLVAWAAAFVPDELPAARLPRAATPSVPVTAPLRASHQPVQGVAEAVVVAGKANKSSPPAVEIAAAVAAHDEPPPTASIRAEWTPEPPSESNPTESSNPEPGQPEANASASPAAPASLPEVPPGLVLINPPSTGGAVHFLLAEEIITLQPGEFHAVAEIDERLIKFDRGEGFGLVEQKVSGEVWMFAVGPRGWHFQLIDRERAATHLKGCRPRSVSADPSAEPATNEP